MDFFDSDNGMVVFSAMMILLTYMGSMFVVCIGTAIYLIYRFYTSTYGDQGYLLHTLPVDKHHIIISKDKNLRWDLLKQHVALGCTEQIKFVISTYEKITDAFLQEEYRPLRHATHEIETARKQLKRK